MGTGRARRMRTCETTAGTPPTAAPPGPGVHGPRATSAAARSGSTPPPGNARPPGSAPPAPARRAASGTATAARTAPTATPPPSHPTTPAACTSVARPRRPDPAGPTPPVTVSPRCRIARVRLVHVAIRRLAMPGCPTTWADPPRSGRHDQGSGPLSPWGRGTTGAPVPGRAGVCPPARPASPPGPSGSHADLPGPVAEDEGHGSHGEGRPDPADRGESGSLLE